MPHFQGRRKQNAAAALSFQALLRSAQFQRDGGRRFGFIFC